MTIKHFRLPDPGEGLVEADIVTWRVAVGEQIKINDIVVEVETSKSLVELPSPYAGTVHALLVNEGDTVDVGVPIIAIDDGVPTEAPADDLVPGVPETAPDEQIEAGKIGGEAPGGRVAILVGYGPKTAESKRRPRKGVNADAGSAEVHDELAAATFTTEAPVSRRADDREALRSDSGETARNGAPLPSPGLAAPAPKITDAAVLAKPPVRKLAKDLGIDLALLRGSGPGGVITRDDVTGASSPEPGPSFPEPELSFPEPELSFPEPGLSFPEPVEGPSTGSGHAIKIPDDDVTRVPIKGVRKATAAAMVQSAFTAPHVSEWVTCDVTATMHLVERLKARRDFADIKVSPLLLVAKAVCIALAHTPELNANWDESAQEIVMRRSVNLGIAAATPRGLVVPNIKSAQALGLADLARSMSTLVSTARAGKTQPAEMSGGTFTVTNIGVFGVDGGTPILNPGESCILCLGQIARRPWVVGTGADERIEPRWVTTLAVSFDHRMADGAQGSTFLSDVAAILGDPALALLY